MVPRAEEFIAALTQDHDVIVIGGLAIIAHGFSRPTKDADIWLDPLDTPSSWASREEAEELLSRFVDWQTCEAALLNNDPAVREMALTQLRELADEGDPFSQAILDNKSVPPP